MHTPSNTLDVEKEFRKAQEQLKKVQHEAQLAKKHLKAEEASRG